MQKCEESGPEAYASNWTSAHKDDGFSRVWYCTCCSISAMLNSTMHRMLTFPFAFKVQHSCFDVRTPVSGFKHVLQRVHRTVKSKIFYPDGIVLFEARDILAFRERICQIYSNVAQNRRLATGRTCTLENVLQLFLPTASANMENHAFR